MVPEDSRLVELIGLDAKKNAGYRRERKQRLYYAEYEKEKEGLEALEGLVEYTEESDDLGFCPSPWRVQIRSSKEFVDPDPSPWLLQRRGRGPITAR